MIWLMVIFVLWAASTAPLASIRRQTERTSGAFSSATGALPI